MMRVARSWKVNSLLTQLGTHSVCNLKLKLLVILSEVNDHVPALSTVLATLMTVTISPTNIELRESDGVEGFQ
jgi:hypothetical protein